MFLLDTNVISELRKASVGRANPSVVAWANQQDTCSLFVSAITIMELEIGILQLERRDPNQGKILRNWFSNQVLPEFADRILEINTDIALRCARLHVPDPRSERDALIAATGLTHNMTVVTRNTGDFTYTGAEILNPWDAS